MNQAEAELLIAEAVIAGVLLPTASAQDLADKASVWADFCSDVPYPFAREVVRKWETGHSRFLTPNRLSNDWHDSRRSAGGTYPYPEAACPWARVCRCSHEDCWHGQMREAEEKETIIDTPRNQIKRYTTGVRWCSDCWDARNIIRQEKSKEPRALGDTRP